MLHPFPLATQGFPGTPLEARTRKGLLPERDTTPQRASCMESPHPARAESTPRQCHRIVGMFSAASVAGYRDERAKPSPLFEQMTCHRRRADCSPGPGLRRKGVRRCACSPTTRPAKRWRLAAESVRQPSAALRPDEHQFEYTCPRLRYTRGIDEAGFRSLLYPGQPQE